MALEITEHTLKTDRHTTFYLAAGPEDGPKIFFLHGWPELSLSWRHQVLALGNLGFRTIAPDMRGYGKSSVYRKHSDYALREVVGDMCELYSSMSNEPVIWVGHDWGSPVVWSIARHHPDQVAGVASLCVPMGLEEGLSLDLIDRSVYPKEQFPVGQWDYMLFYVEDFQLATEQMDSDPGGLVKMMFRKGAASSKGTRSKTASIRANGGWFVDGKFPDFPLDTKVLSSAEFGIYKNELERNGFFGPNSWYMNHEANKEYAKESGGNCSIEKPVLFIHAEYDLVCETVESDLAKPMRLRCKNLSEVVLKAGHWVAQEKGSQVSAALVRWLAKDVNYWPRVL